MKNESVGLFLNDLWRVLISVAIAAGAVGCMASGLMLHADNWLLMLTVWSGIALLCCLCARLRWGAAVLSVALLTIAGLLLADGSLLDDLEAMLVYVSSVFRMNYGQTGNALSYPDPGLLSMDLALGFIGSLCSAVCAACLCANAGAFPCIIIGLFPLSACLFIPNAAPKDGWLFLLMTAFLLLMVTSTVRRRSQKDGLRLVALLLAPAILAVSLAFLIPTPTGYQSQLRVAQEKFLAWFEKTFPSQDSSLLPGGDRPLYTEVTDLTALGPQVRRYYPVMDITSDFTAPVYLRGQAYDTYDGKSWNTSYDAYANMDWPSAESRQEIGKITISTQTLQPLRYFPYYPAGLYWFSEFGRGYLANIESVTQYSFRVTQLREDILPAPYPAPRDSNAGSSSLIYAPNPDDEPNLRLPAATRAAALAYLQRYDLSQAVTQREKALQICRLVSESAAYSLNTPQMPENEEDFAMWFLERSDTGYCVHFATAAVVLLRASGIQARYVTGYARSVYAGQTVTVNAHHAHAWVEYYDEAYQCWRPLDPTPDGPDSTRPDNNTGTENDPVPTVPPTEQTEPPATDSTVPPQTQPTEGPLPTETQEAAIGGADPPGQVTQTPGSQFPWGWLIGPLAAAVLAAGQYFLRRLWWKRRLASGPPNTRALARWRLAVRYGKALRTPPPAELLELAEKARFSQHTLTQAELAQFDGYLAHAARLLKKQSLPVRSFWRLVLAIA